MRSRISVWLLWGLLTLLAAGYVGYRFYGPSPLQTDLLAMLPASESDPAAEIAVNRLTDALGQRAVFLIGAPTLAQAEAGAQRFADAITGTGTGSGTGDIAGTDGAALSRTGSRPPASTGSGAPAARVDAPAPAFTQVLAKVPPFDLSQIAATYLPYRFGLLTADDRTVLQRLAAEDGPHREQGLRALLDARLYSPGADLGNGAPLADDPFGFLSHWLAQLPLTQGRLQLQDGFLVVPPPASTSTSISPSTAPQVLVLATVAGSAYASDTQGRVLQAVARGQSALDAMHVAGMTLVRTGAVFYAESARASAQSEVHVIGMVSLFGVALLMLWVFRSPRWLLLAFLSTALGTVCALALTLWWFGQVYLLTFVFGASLIGEAVDYSIQYFVEYAGSQHRRHAPRDVARRIRPALSVALATSLLGYAVLGAMPFPALRQIACFAFAGIGMAFLSVMTLLPTLLPHAGGFPDQVKSKGAARTGERLFIRAGRGLTRVDRVLRTLGIRRIVAVVLVISLPGWLALRSDDDVHRLVQRDPSLVAQESVVRNALGIDDGSQFLLIRGADADAVLAASGRIDAALKHWQDGPASDSHDRVPLRWQTLTQFVPPASVQRADAMLVDQVVFADPGKLRVLMADAGLRDDVIAQWFAAHGEAMQAMRVTGRAAGRTAGRTAATEMDTNKASTPKTAAAAATATLASTSISTSTSISNPPADPVLTMADWLRARWTPAYGQTWLGAMPGADGKPAVAAIIMLQGIPDDDREAAAVLSALERIAAQASDAQTHVGFVDKARSVSRLFGEYRARTAVWLAGVSLLILLLLSWRYGFGGAVRVVLPTAFAVAITLAIFGYTRFSLTLFNTLALMLVLGVGVNYAVFLREGYARMSQRHRLADASVDNGGTGRSSNDVAAAELGSVWVGVLLSAATTFLSFGLLGWSAMPALRDFGLTLSMGIALSVLLAPLGLPRPHDRVLRHVPRPAQARGKDVQ